MEHIEHQARFLAAKYIAAAQKIEGLESAPPKGYPALPGPDVQGYRVINEDVTDHFFRGQKRGPGDDGFYDMITRRVLGEPEPAGWTHITRPANRLYACIAGNPIEYERIAQDMGYPRAIATSPCWLCLGEVLIEVVQK